MQSSVDSQGTGIVGSKVLRVRLAATVVALVGVDAKVVRALMRSEQSLI
jgi:hypothetical protein